jgi:nucleoside-diphosphate kinase
MRAMQRAQDTLVLFKPDALQRGLCGEILARFERAGLRPVRAREARLTRSHLHRHYADLRTRHPVAFDRNIPYLVDKTVLAFVLRGPNAVAKVRALIGPTDPLQAAPGTIRGDYSSDSVALCNSQHRGLDNLVHASDSVTSARREIRLWFPRR